MLTARFQKKKKTKPDLTDSVRWKQRKLKAHPGGKQTMSNLWIFNSFTFCLPGCVCVCSDPEGQRFRSAAWQHMLPIWVIDHSLYQSGAAPSVNRPRGASVWAAVTKRIRLPWPLMAWEACHVSVWYLPTPPAPAASQPHHRRSILYLWRIIHPCLCQIVAKRPEPPRFSAEKLHQHCPSIYY